MKQKYTNIGFYCRFGGRVYTLDELKRKWEREKAMKKNDTGTDSILR